MEKLALKVSEFLKETNQTKDVTTLVIVAYFCTVQQLCSSITLLCSKNFLREAQILKRTLLETLAELHIIFISEEDLETCERFAKLKFLKSADTNSKILNLYEENSSHLSNMKCDFRELFRIIFSKDYNSPGVNKDTFDGRSISDHIDILFNEDGETPNKEKYGRLQYKIYCGISHSNFTSMLYEISDENDRIQYSFVPTEKYKRDFFKETELFEEFSLNKCSDIILKFNNIIKNKA